MSNKLNVVIWNEFRHEKLDKNCAAIYPEGIHGAIAEGLRLHEDMEVRTAMLDLTQEQTFVNAVKGNVDGIFPTVALGVEGQKIIDALISSSEQGKWEKL